MTPPDAKPPATTRRAILVAAAVGVLALAAFEPAAVAGAGCGLALAAVASGFDGSYRRAALSAGLVPPVVLGAVAAVGLAGTPTARILAAVGVIVALAAGGAVGRPSRTALERAGSTARYAGVVAAAGSLLAFAVADAGGTRRALAAAVRATGDGVQGALLAVVVAGFALLCAVFAVPPAAFATPSERDTYVRVQAGVLKLIVVGTLAAIVLLATLTALSWYLLPLEFLLEAVVDSVLLRGASVIATALGVVGVAVSAVVRYSWEWADGRGSATVALLAGATGGVLVPFGVGFAASDAVDLVGIAFGAAAVALLAGGAVAWAVVASRDAVDVPPAGTVVGVGLAGGGVAVGATVEAATASLETILVGSIAFVAIAAGLFAHDVGRYGRTLAREVGAAGADARPQFVRVGWSALVAAVGVPVAIVGLAAATVLAPTLSVPATAAVVVALATILAGGWLLFG